MINFKPLRAEDVLALDSIIAIQAGMKITPEYAVDLEQIGGVTAFDGDTPIGTAGIMPMWSGTGLAWALLGLGWRKHARAITNEIIRVLDKTEMHRIELAVKVDFDAGKRWAKRLGFVLETPVARKWGPDQGDYSIFARVK